MVLMRAHLDIILTEYFKVDTPFYFSYVSINVVVLWLACESAL